VLGALISNLTQRMLREREEFAAGRGRSYCGSVGRGTRQKWCWTWKKQRQRCYGGADSSVMEM